MQTDSSKSASGVDGRDPHGLPPVYLPLGELVPDLAVNVATLEYWAALPQQSSGVRLMQDCDLLDLAAHLPQCLVLDLKGPTTWTVIMFGTELVDTFGLDATGLNSYDFYADEEKPFVAHRMATMQERSAAMIVTSRLKNAAGITVETEWLFLPLADADGNISRALVSTASFMRPAELRNFELAGNLEDRRVLKLVYGCVDRD